MLQQFRQTLPWRWPEQYIMILNDTVNNGTLQIKQEQCKCVQYLTQSRIQYTQKIKNTVHTNFFGNIGTVEIVEMRSAVAETVEVRR